MKKYPKDFLWGVATASYQIEGAAFEDGKGASIWDSFSHVPGNIISDDNGDIACDHYHRYKEDVHLMKELGIKSYRFSIAWARILPDGRGQVNQAGIDFYNRLIDSLIEAGVEPMVTLYHWDLPQALQEEGGWSDASIIEAFVEYAKIAFDTFGDRVKKWITHNEPWVVAYAGHHVGRHAPGIKDFHTALKVSHHLMLTHACTVEAYKKSLFGDGEIGITLNLFPTSPASEKKVDKDAAVFVDGYHNRWFLDPILKGTYPKDIYERFNKEYGFHVSEEEMEIIASNKLDFLGVNYYHRIIVRHDPKVADLRFVEVKPAGEYTDMNWEIYPDGLYESLIRVKNDFGDIPLYITENGASYGMLQTMKERIQDDLRINFLKTHFEAALKAINDGVNLKGYFVWSFLDNFEWAHGYEKRFGIIDVDYNTLKRTPKASALWYKTFIYEENDE
jgi:beta-glucosidase